MTKLWSIHFKSESSDDYYFTVKSKEKPTTDEVLKWLFEIEEVDGGTEGWDMPYNEIPFGALEINDSMGSDADFDSLKRKGKL